MITESGCFGGSGTPLNPIDDANEAAQAVKEIVENMQPAEESGTLDVIGLALVQHRVKMLTWAVVAMAVYLVIKELK